MTSLAARISLVALALAAVAAAWLGPPRAAGGGDAVPGVLHVGDTVRVAGTDVGCAVARRSGSTVVECMPARHSAGSYATLTGSRAVLVVRFRSATTAKTVFQAKQHDPQTRTCR